MVHQILRLDRSNGRSAGYVVVGGEVVVAYTDKFEVVM
jgi:hypothetical protein